MQSRKKWLVYFVVMVAFIDTFSQLPIMSPFAQNLGASPLIIGLIVGMYSFTNIIGNVAAGYWIDHNGPRKVLFYGLLSTGIILVLYAFVNTPLQLLAVRFLHGASGGLVVPAVFTYIANRNKKGRHGRTMALSGAAVGIAAIVGPAYGGIVASSVSVVSVFYSIAALMIVCSLFTFLFPEPRKKSEDKPQPAKSIGQLLLSPPLLNAYLGSFALMFAQGVLAYMLPLKVESLHMESHVTGALLSTFGIVAILIFILPTNRLFDRFHHRKTMFFGMVTIAVGLVILSQVTSVALMFVSMVVYGTGFAFLYPSISALIVQHTDVSDRGKAFGLFYAFFSLGVVAGSLTIGALAVSADSGFLIGALVLLLSTVAALFIKKSSPSS